MRSLPRQVGELIASSQRAIGCCSGSSEQYSELLRGNEQFSVEAVSPEAEWSKRAA